VHGRMPVEAAIKSRSELTRRPGVGIGVHQVRDFVRVLLVDAIEGQAGEAGGERLIERRMVERRIGNETSGENQDASEQPQHGCMVSEARVA